MPLERIYTHHFIRVLRVLVPLLIVVLIGIPAWNYITKQALRSPGEQPVEQLPSDLALRTEGFTFSRTEGGRTLFTIRAARNLGFKDNRNMLEDVEVVVFGATEGEPARRIRSRTCSYDQETQDIRFEGAVEVQLDERTTARGEELVYNHRDRIVASGQKTLIEQPGAMTGQAKRLEYSLTSGLLKLMGDVEVRTAQQMTLQTASALFHQKENWTTMEGGLLIKSATGWIRGKTGRAALESGTYNPRVITIAGNVTAESQGQGSRDLWQLGADWIEAEISAATGNVERVKTRGNVEIKLTNGNARQVLTAGEVDAGLTASGDVDVLHAQQGPQMTLGADRTLRSDDIWVNAVNSIETGGNSVLQVGPSTIAGRQFTIQQGDIVSFRTLHPATLQSGTQESSADQTRASFDSRTNTFGELVQTGNFKFKNTNYTGSAENARFEDGGAVVTLEGSPVVTDAEKRLEAAEIRLDQKSNSFIATRNVRTFIESGPDSLLVKAARVEGDADSMLYTGKVELWRGMAYIKAELIRAASLGQTNKLYAEGKGDSRVQTDFNTVRTTSDTLDYDEGRGVARYTGRVRAAKQAMILETPDLTVTLAEDKSVAEITANRGVVVTQGGQRGTGAQAVYQAATDTVTLTGNPAQIHDRGRGAVEGARFIMKTSGETALVEGGKGGRTVTRHPVNKK